MSPPVDDLSGEPGRFTLRVGLLIILAVGILEYRRVPPAARKDAPAAHADSAASAGAELAARLKEHRLVVDGVDLGADTPDARELREKISKEAAEGAPGPAIQRVLEAARRRGLQDKIKVRGQSLNEYLSQAQALGARAEGANEKYRRAMGEATGYDFSKEDPRAVAADAVRQIASPHYEKRHDGVLTLCELRYAAYAKTALPKLRELAKSDDPEISDMAKLAVMRVKIASRSRKWNKNLR